MRVSKTPRIYPWGWFSLLCTPFMRKPLFVLVAFACLMAGLVMAWHHPLWPMFSLVVFWMWCCTAAWQPRLWLWVVPAFLPLLNFSPWTGWLVFEEFDLLLLGTLAGGYARLAWMPQVDHRSQHHVGLRLLLLFVALSGVWALWRGFDDAGGFMWDWFAGYSDALNSWRVSKSLVFSMLLIPLLPCHKDEAHKIALLGWGMVAGLTLVTLATLWERAAFPGVVDFSAHYRTVALFWEMNMGGAAIDVYLAISAPFVVWALLTTRRPVVWAFLAVLSILTVYAGLTTFSRGVYLAMAAPLLVLTWLLWRQDHIVFRHVVWRRVRREGEWPSWHHPASWLLSLVLVIEVVAVLQGGTFMSERIASSKKDFSSRIEHWQHGLGLLTSPSDVWFGKGLGRLPANYAAMVPKQEFSGDVKYRTEQHIGQADNAFITLYGPKTQAHFGGDYELTQRVDAISPGQHRVRLDVRVEKNTKIELYLCERHLLYDRHCQYAVLQVKPVKGSNHAVWQSVSATLHGDSFEQEPWYAPRLKMFSIAVANAGGVADIDNLAWTGQGTSDVLANGDFSAGLSHWFPAAQSYFVPWHLDNLFLEVLVERGVVGLLAWLMLLGYALWHLVWGRSRSKPLSPYMAASLAGVLLVGLVSSVMDMPRVAFLFFVFMFWTVKSARADTVTAPFSILAKENTRSFRLIRA